MTALLTDGTFEQWLPVTDPRHLAGELDGIGIAYGPGSWPPYDADEATMTIDVMPSPAYPDSDGRYATTPTWSTDAHLATPGGRLTKDPARRRLPAGLLHIEKDGNDSVVAVESSGIPWNPAWRGAGGTQWERADNGIIIENGDGTAWVLQGLRLAQWWDLVQLNVHFRTTKIKQGTYVADAIRFVSPDRVQRGSQGPWSKLDGLLRPEHFSGELPPPPWISFVGFNVAHGPGAKPYPHDGALVEHPGKGQRAKAGGLPVKLPEGDDPRMIRPGQRFTFAISNEQIAQWLDDENVPPTSPLRQTKRRYATLLRDVGLRVKETGTGQPIVESTGGVNPAEAAKWAAIGVTAATARDLGRNLFRYGTIQEAA